MMRKYPRKSWEMTRLVPENDTRIDQQLKKLSRIHIKQQIKRNKTNEKRRKINAAYRSSYKSAVKSLELALSEKNIEVAEKALNLVNKKLDKGNSKGIFHKNFVSRNKSQFSKLLNNLSK